MFGKKTSAGLAQPATRAAKPRRSPSAEEVVVDDEPGEAGTGYDSESSDERSRVIKKLQRLLFQRVDVKVAASLSKTELQRQIAELVREIAEHENIALLGEDLRRATDSIIDDMVGLGPLEPLLKDPGISDILVNGPNKIFIERKGKLELSEIRFRDHQHVFNVAQRIVSQVGRRIDESSPICDARLHDGSRVNVIAPPVALDGCSISIRKFSKQPITLAKMVQGGSVSPTLMKLLEVAAACRLNLIVAGGTGSGKTTMLNALSQLIHPAERVVTIEDAAELQLQQPHVVRLETRPPSLEGSGEITIRDLVKNALRMRPDRIICGEVRGPEAFDMLQAMNTGHDGSMCTIHANTPREALTRVENLVAMASPLPVAGIRTQLSSALNLIIQMTRMRDGVRRVTHVAEIGGQEGDVVIIQDLFKYEYTGEGSNGKLIGNFMSSKLKPLFYNRAVYYKLEEKLHDAIFRDV